ncbi:rhamnogalacturonan acetylesterase [uncultured Cyclobacterium sp.]|uniref:rhamnogalacturonan acetylesterase n=1 Tax=uncultured Cyclobacterium sp. TaxID=453820 RepID=UPI0030EC3221|tara:strand:+ start:17267 stop:18019 length:753 start_codon:yes stop_codon:yes gene_type:complete
MNQSMRVLVFLLAIGCFAFTTENYRATHIFMIGDSTMANKPERNLPEYGWGQVLNHFFTDEIVVDNHAKNGRSSKSFIDEGSWEKVINRVQEGDYVIIQFGHNDQKSDTARYTGPFDTYQKNLKKFLNETKEKGGIPILCTSIVRRLFDENGILKDSHGDYLTGVIQVANETGVYFIDMEAKTRKLVESLGPEKSKKLYLFFESGIYPHRPEGQEDNTHLSQLGTFTIAGLAIEEMKILGIPLVKELVKK